MIWISRGRGSLAFWIPLAFLIGPLLLDEWLHFLPKDRHLFGLIWGSFAMAAAILTIVLGFSWNRGPGYWTIDSSTGLRYFDKSAKHSWFFIPMQYWGFFYCAVLIAIAVLNR